MKKLMIFLMAALVLTGTLLVSCNQNVGEDKLGSVTISQDMARTLSSSAESTLPGSDDIAWFYKAVKNDDGFFVTGQTNGFVSLTGTLSGKNLGNFSYGDWLFSFEGRDSGSNVIYSCYDLPATINNPQTNLTVPLTLGSGASAPTVEFRGLSFELDPNANSSNTSVAGLFKLVVNDETGEIFTVTTGSMTYPEGGVSFDLSSVTDALEDSTNNVYYVQKTYGAVTSHTYGFKVYFHSSNSSITSTEEGYWGLVADRTLSVLIPFGTKTTISGSVLSIETVSDTTINGVIHNYAIDTTDGSWDCSNGHDAHTLPGTTTPYITVVVSGQPTEIIALENGLNRSVGSGNITVNGNNVTYTGSGANGQEVVILTDGYETTLAVNAPQDTVHHYGVAGNVSIVAVNTSSYHENGTVPFLEAAGGHIVFEELSSVVRVHFTATGEGNAAQFINENNQTISLDLSNLSEQNMPEFSRDPVSIDTNGTYVAEVKTEFTEYIWLFGNGTQTEMVSTQNAGAIAENGELKEGITAGAEDGSIAEQIANSAVYDEQTSETTYVPKTSKEEAQEEAVKSYTPVGDVELTINGVVSKYFVDDYKGVEDKYNATFEMFSDVLYSASRGKSGSDLITITLNSDLTAVYGGFYFRLAKAIEQQYYEPTQSKKFVAVDDIPTIIFDLNSHKLTLDTTSQSAFVVMNANLIITDSSEGQTGELSSASSWTIDAKGNACVTLNGGKVSNTGDGGWFSVGIGIGTGGDAVVNSSSTGYVPGTNLYIKGTVTSPVDEDDVVRQMREETAEGSTMTIDLENWCAIFTIDD